MADDAAKGFRSYVSDAETPLERTVRNHYRLMRTHQTIDFVSSMRKRWETFDNGSYTLREIFEILDGYVDSSDPDSVLPNVEHALQTAEGIRADGQPDWLALTGLIHDVGKIMFAWHKEGQRERGQEGSADGAQWALGGDTWVVGAPIPNSMVFPEFNSLNPDVNVSIYEDGCGLENLNFAYGHDEYLYRVLKNAPDCTLPEEALAMIRYHSCYALHRDGEYQNLLAPGDDETIEWVRLFNKYDLYTKHDETVDREAVFSYYEGLFLKYIGSDKLAM